MNEFDAIKTYFAPLAGEGAFGLTDDAAVFGIPEGMELVVTKDAICEGVHFVGNEEPALIARKLLRTNLSDLAAMGAKPYAYFLAGMLHETVDSAWLESFATGLKHDQEQFGISLMGGDTTRAKGPLSLSLTAMGLVKRGQALRRAGAKAGEHVYVTGTLGDAALGLQVVTGALKADGKDAEYLAERYRLPLPRVEFGQALQGVATSCIDISDGLMQDLGHITECSAVGSIVAWDRLPLSDAARRVLSMLAKPHEIIAAGGDDYELLFTAPAQAHEALQSAARIAKVAVTHIGEITKGSGVKLVDKDGKELLLAKSGYDHFSVKK